MSYKSMDFIIEQHIRDFGEKREKDTSNTRGQYAEATIKNYISGIRTLHKMVQGTGALFDDLDWARDHTKVFQVIKTKDNIQTKRNLVNSLIASLQTIGYPSEVIRPYEDLRDTYQAQYQAAGHLTPKQKIIMTAIKQKDILDFLAEESLDPELTQDMTRFSSFVIMSIHTIYPFRNECGDMKMIRRVIYEKLGDEQKKANNWLVLDKGFDKMSFVMTNFKTMKVFGIREMEVEPKITKFIHKICQLRDIKLKDVHNVPVFITSRGDAFNKNKVSKHLGDYTTKGLGHPISTTIMAKMFGTSCVDPVNPTPEELVKLRAEADMRGQSMKMKFSVYGNLID